MPAEQQCHQCHEHAHRYRCPACDIRTCSLACTKAHKQEKTCTGKRSRTEMVNLSDFTERQLLSDYKFLEEAARLHDVAQRSEAPRPARQLPLGLQNFVDEVRIPPYGSLLSKYSAGSPWQQHILRSMSASDTTPVDFESFTCMALLLTRYHGVFPQTDTCQILLPIRFMMLECFTVSSFWQSCIWCIGWTEPMLLSRRVSNVLECISSCH